MKDERELLTRPIICNKLVREAKRRIAADILVLVVFAPLELFIYLVLSSFKVLGVLWLIAFMGLLCFQIFSIARSLLLISKARKGEFTVVEDTLLEVEERKLDKKHLLLTVLTYGIRGIFSRANYNHVFKFKSGKTFIANLAEYQNTRLDAAAQFSQSGDTFFLAFYNDAPEKIILLYSSKIYNYSNR